MAKGYDGRLHALGLLLQLPRAIGMEPMGGLKRSDVTDAILRAAEWLSHESADVVAMSDGEIASDPRPSFINMTHESRSLRPHCDTAATVNDECHACHSDILRARA